MEDKSKLEKKTKSLLNEYNVVHDVKEALLCMKELECPGYYPEIVKVIVNRTCSVGWRFREFSFVSLTHITHLNTNILNTNTHSNTNTRYLGKLQSKRC